MYQPRIEKAENDLVYDEQGRSYIDLFTAHGATWLGHANPRVTRAIVEQMGKVWLTGGLETAVHAEARSLVEGFFPPSHRLAALYSTGMEAAEFAIRVARVTTGRTGVVGFENSMHGKSLATSQLGWDNRDGMSLPSFHRLPFVGSCDESEILVRLERVLADGTISAVFVEPLQGSGGGRSASRDFYAQVHRLCNAHGAMLVFDEILTGFYRTGPAFFFSELGFVPTAVLVGKGMGNGFPVSGLVLDRETPVRGEMLPGSTFSMNPLASAAVVATLAQVRTLDLSEKVAAIETIVSESLGDLKQVGVVARGKGALWILDIPPGREMHELVVGIYRRGVSVGFAGRQIRILPAATIDPDNLRKACSAVREELTGGTPDGGDGLD